MAAEIKPYSEVYLNNGFEHPYGENNHDALGGVQRVLSRGSTYLLGLAIIPTYGAFHHAKEAFSNSHNHETYIQHISYFTNEIVELANGVETIGAALLMTGSAVPIATTLIISSIATIAFIFLAHAIAKFQTGDTETSKELLKEIAVPAIIIGAFKLYFKSFDTTIKAIAVVTLCFKGVEFACYSAGWVPENDNEEHEVRNGS